MIEIMGTCKRCRGEEVELSAQNEGIRNFTNKISLGHIWRCAAWDDRDNGETGLHATPFSDRNNGRETTSCMFCTR